MATYTPKNLIGPAQALTSSVATYVSGSGIVGVLRTIQVLAQTTAITFTLSLGADAAGTRIFALEPLTSNVTFTRNGWWITAANSAHAIDMTSNATGTDCIGHVSGYEYS